MRRALKTYPVIAIDVEILPCSSHLPLFLFHFFFSFPPELLTVVQSLHNLRLTSFPLLMSYQFLNEHIIDLFQLLNNIFALIHAQMKIFAKILPTLSFRFRP